MAVDQKERSAKSAKKREEFDEKELRHRLRLGTRQKLEELMQWNDIEEISEAVQNLILNAHALGPKLSYEAIQGPRRKVTISERVARMLSVNRAGKSRATPLTKFCFHVNYFFSCLGGVTFGIGRVLWIGGKPRSVAMPVKGGFLGFSGFLSLILQLRIMAFEMLVHLFFSFCQQLFVFWNHHHAEC